ncbi:hypothetical protein EV421DRAFT_1896593 [Armillaria borealis]|uniref:N-acetyltransferase domain-containing protein n=1 Tax=Armillaria borealis TaxID=47425 RepID=A0AA39N2D5_9AGAR|nr:hypothetical protein EV421DRAFT_1896593 [Armillaria borealis]
MSPFTIRHVDSLNAEELEIAVDLTVKAYDDMLVARAMVGDDKNLMDPLFRSMIRAADSAGTIDLACDVSDSDKIVGMAVWFGPGKSLFADAEQRELGLNEFMDKLSPETRQWWEKTAIQSGTITALVTTTDVNESIYEKGPVAFRVMSRS